jgi:hypothetical protein
MKEQKPNGKTYLPLPDIYTPIDKTSIIMAFVLGAKGNEWAWDRRKSDNVEHFKKTQRNWAYAGFAVAGVIVIALVIIIAVAAATD